MSKTISNKDAMTMALEDAKTDSPNSISNKDKLKAVFNAATQGLAASPNSISNRDKKFLRDAVKDVKSANTISNRDVQTLKDAGTNKNMGGTMKKYNMGGTMKNYQDGGANSISNRDAMEMAKEDMIATTAEGMMTPVTLGGNSISNRDVEFMDKVVKGKAKKNKKPKSELPDYRRNMGGTMKNYRAGGIEAADKEGSRLSISMERQEDAGYSPSEADFDQQNRLAAEGIMEVGADVTTIQGHNSRASLGETEGVRGTGAMVRGTKFVGVL